MGGHPILHIIRAQRRRKLPSTTVDFACRSDYSSFQGGHVISNKNNNNSHVFSFDITSPKIVNFQLSISIFPAFFVLANEKSGSLTSGTNQASHREHVTGFCP
jgi:hypothetical protein